MFNANNRGSMFNRKSKVALAQQRHFGCWPYTHSTYIGMSTPPGASELMRKRNPHPELAKILTIRLGWRGSEAIPYHTRAVAHNRGRHWGQRQCVPTPVVDYARTCSCRLLLPTPRTYIYYILASMQCHRSKKQLAHMEGAGRAITICGRQTGMTPRGAVVAAGPKKRPHGSTGPFLGRLLFQFGNLVNLLRSKALF